MSRSHCALGLPRSSGRSRLNPTREAASLMSTVSRTTGRPCERGSAAVVEDRATTEGEDAVVLGERKGHRLLLQGPERCLALVDEEVRDGHPGDSASTSRVGVAEGDAETRGDEPPDRGLAGTGRPDEHQRRAASADDEVRRGSRRRLRAVSATESPPNFSSTASARTSATIASATTPAAGTAHTSERWLIALAASPVRDVDGVQRPRARWRSASSRRGPAAPRRWSCRPRCRRRGRCDGVRRPGRARSRPAPASRGSGPSSNPSPTSTPLMAWMPISAPASRESSRRSQCTWLPRPGGSPCTTTSTTPPRVSPSRRGGVDLGDHRRARSGVEAAHRVSVDPLGVATLGNNPERGRALRRARRRG